MYKTKENKNKNISRCGSGVESKKGNLSTKFSSSKVLKDPDYLHSLKKVPTHEMIEEVPEPSYNSSMNSNAFNWKMNKLESRNSVQQGTPSSVFCK
jgi:hypothetical protein